MFISTGDIQLVKKKKLIYANHIIQMIFFKRHTYVIHTERLYLKYSLSAISASTGHVAHIVFLTSVWIDSFIGKLQQKLRES